MIDKLDMWQLDAETTAQYSRPLTRARVANDYNEFRRLIVEGKSCENSRIYDWLVSHDDRSTDFLMLLIAAGHPLDKTDDWGWTALHMACSFGKYEHVKILVAAGANMTICSPQKHRGMGFPDGNTRPVSTNTCSSLLTAYEITVSYVAPLHVELSIVGAIRYRNRRLCLNALEEPPDPDIQQKIRDLRAELLQENPALFRVPGSLTKACC